MSFKKIFFDFDGVLCHDHFYSNLKKNYPEVIRFINENVFTGNFSVSDKWMKGELSYKDVNRYISKNTGIDYKVLTNLFLKSVYTMKIDKRLLKLVKLLLLRGYKVALVTDNMDVFNFITIKNHKLDQIFPVIVNSFDYGLVKCDSNGKLFDIALRKIKEKDYSNALLIDDSFESREMFNDKGGAVFSYKNFKDFDLWAKKNLL